MKNDFYFTDKAPFVLEIFKFLIYFFLSFFPWWLLLNLKKKLIEDKS